MKHKVKIADEFNKIIEEICEYHSLKDFLENVVYYDLHVLGYRQTTRLYDEYRDECQDWVCYFLENYNMDTSESYMFSCWDFVFDFDDETCRITFLDTEKNKFFIVESMFKNHCSELLDVLNQQKNI